MSARPHWARKRSVWRVGQFLKPEESSGVMSQGKLKIIQNIRRILPGENNMDTETEEPGKRVNSDRLGCKGLHLNIQGFQE